jgi:hypothetical protein
LNNGAFKAMASSNKIRSVFVDIEPPTDLEFEAGASFTLDFDVNDEDINGDPVKCAAALQGMKVMSADSATSSSAKSEGGCMASSMTTAGTCFCKGTISHFSVFGVVEGDADSSSAASSTGSIPAAASSTGSGASIKIGSGSIKLGSGSIRFGNEL